MRYFECKATVKTPVDIHTEEGADICGFAAAKSEKYHTAEHRNHCRTEKKVEHSSLSIHTPPI